MSGLESLEKALGVQFNDPSLLERAMCHTSYLNEPPGKSLVSNERMEFLGDAILGFIIADKLYADFASSEGELTKMRASLVRQETLAELAKRLGLGAYLLLGKGEETSGGRQKPTNLARALEALVAAVFLDKGIEPTREFVQRVFQDEFDSLAKGDAEVNFKSKLQELLQSNGRKTPTYEVVNTSGLEHDRVFTVEVRSGNDVLGRGSGKSKKMAETEAARAALANLLK